MKLPKHHYDFIFFGYFSPLIFLHTSLMEGGGLLKVSIDVQRFGGYIGYRLPLVTHILRYDQKKKNFKITIMFKFRTTIIKKKLTKIKCTSNGYF